MNRKPIYTQLLSQEERANAINVGVITKVASVVAGSTKEASVGGVISGLADLGIKGVILGSVVTGVPIGIMAHIMHKKITKTNQKEKDLKKELDFYNEATRSIETGLADELKSKGNLINSYKYV